MDIKPLKINDIFQIEVSEYEKGLRNYRDFKEWIELRMESGTAYTVRKDGKVIGCMGVSVLWNGVGEGWAFFDKNIEKYKITAFKSAKYVLEESFKKYDLHRVQVIVQANIKHIMFSKRLGFQYEGHFKKYDFNKNDYLCYAIVR